MGPMALRSCFAVLLALSCSSQPPPHSSDDADQPASELAEGSSSESGDTPKADEAPAAASSEPASTADLQAILQLVIDDEALQPYLHLELPDRHPLRVSGEALPSGIELRKGEKPAQIVDAAAAEDKKKAVLVFTEIQVQGDRATIAYRYDIEKVRGSATVTKSDGNWTLHKSRVTARDLAP
jgi:hypothetical protein